MKNLLIVFSLLNAVILTQSCTKNIDNPTSANSEIITESSDVDIITNLNVPDSLIFNFKDTLATYGKPILFYMFTDWCRGCRSVEQTTLKNEYFIKESNEKFSFYKIDGDLPYHFILKDSVYVKQKLMNDFMYTFYEPSNMASYPSYMIINLDEEVNTIIPPQFKAKHEEMFSVLENAIK